MIYLPRTGWSFRASSFEAKATPFVRFLSKSFWRTGMTKVPYQVQSTKLYKCLKTSTTTTTTKINKSLLELCLARARQIILKIYHSFSVMWLSLSLFFLFFCF